MNFISTVTGILIEARQLTCLQCSHLPRKFRPRAHWDVWIETDGKQCQFIVEDVALPAREGHTVTVLAMDDRTVGLYNTTTGRTVNYLVPAHRREGVHHARLRRQVDATLLRLERGLRPDVDVPL